MPSIYQMFDGSYMDLDKILNVSDIQYSEYSPNVHDVKFCVVCQLREQALVYQFSAYRDSSTYINTISEFDKPTERDAVSEWSNNVITDYREIWQNFITAWKTYKKEI